MSLVLKVACPACGSHQDSLIGTEVRCERCGNDFRALGHGESSTRIVSVTPDELAHVPYSQRSTEVPRSTASSLVISDPALLDDRLLRDLPMADSARWAGRVRLIKKLGQGGMGAVYRGFDEQLALDVAVKVLPIPPGGKELHYADRFRMEARISAQINHANVVRTRDVGEHGDVVFLVMDYVDGQTARQMLDRKGVIPVPHVLQIVHDAALGMQAAHERGIVHRDIKPENILVANDGRVLLADLGLAKSSGSRPADALMPITQMGVLLGTPDYMSPEQWDIGAHITPRADIWSMGATLWVLLTRRPPFEDPDIGQLAKKIKEAPLPDIHALRPDVPPKVAAILYHCMAKNPQRRYMNAGALVAALHQAMLHPDQADDDEIYATPVQSTSSNQGAVQETRSAILGPVIKQPEVRPAPPSAVALNVAVSKPAKSKSKNKAAGSAAQKANNAVIVKHDTLTVTRVLAWASVPALAACLILGVYLSGGIEKWTRKGDNTHVASKPTTSDPQYPGVLKVIVPPRVKGGDTATLTASLSGVDDADKHKIVWRSGKDVLEEGPALAAEFATEREFEVSAVDPKTNKIVAREFIRVEPELRVSAAEDLPAADTVDEIETPKPTKRFVAKVKGAAPEKLEYRWFDPKKPAIILGDKAVLDLTISSNEKAGSRTLNFQARRKGAADWNDAGTGVVAFIVKPPLPEAYVEGMAAAAKLFKSAEETEVAESAQAALNEALKHYDKAAAAYEKGDAGNQKLLCVKKLEALRKYTGTLAEARDFSLAAEKIPFSNLTEKFALITKASDKYIEAQSYFNGQEVKNERALIKVKADACTSAFDNKEKNKQEYEAKINEARRAVAKAETYQNFADALPHWEAALIQFEQLKAKFPEQLKNFDLDMKRVQEIHDVTYMSTYFGIKPSVPKDRPYDVPVRETVRPRGPLSNAQESGTQPVTPVKGQLIP